MGMLKKAASGVLALLPCSRTESTLRASKGLRPCWIDPSERLRACFFEHSLPLMRAVFPGASMGHGPEIFNRPVMSPHKSRQPGVVALNERKFPGTVPFLELLFPSNGVGHGVMQTDALLSFFVNPATNPFLCCQRFNRGFPLPGICRPTTLLICFSVSQYSFHSPHTAFTPIPTGVTPSGPGVTGDITNFFSFPLD